MGFSKPSASPLELTPDGKIRLSMRKFNIPTSYKPRNAIITVIDNNLTYRFSEIRQAFAPINEPELSEKVIQIITLSDQGMSEIELAGHLDIGIYSVKYH